MRLINATRLKIRIYHNKKTVLSDTLVECIDETPIAYNLERVMEQLEEFRPELEQHGCGGILTDMIEVVQRGGIE